MFKHLQRLLLMAALLCVPWVTQSQSLTDFVLTVDTTTFTSIASTGSSVSLSSTDDGYGTCYLPFAFPFGESSLNANNPISCSANGFICLTGTASGTYASYTNSSMRIINALLNQDAHMGRNSGAGVFYQLDTVDGLQCFTIEYHLMGSYSSPYGVYSFQIKLFQDGDIHLVYDTMNTGGSSRTLRTFFWDGPEGELAMVSGSWANPSPFLSSTAVTRPDSPVPAHGLRYTFTRPVVSCPKPMSVSISNLQSHSVQLGWTSAPDVTPSEWDILITSSVDSSLDGVHMQAYTDTFTVSGLMDGTPYIMAVRAVCDADDTSLYRAVEFITPCDPVLHDSLPYIEDFESYAASTTGPINPCWVKGYNSGGTITTTSYPYISSIGGTKALYFYGYSTSYYSWAVLPPFEDSLNTLMVSFKLYKTSSSYGSIEVGVMDNPNDMSTWHPIASRTPADLGTWEPFVVSLSNYSGTGFIAFRQASTYYTYLDDVTVDVLPTCAPISMVSASNITANSAFIEWGFQPGVAPNDPVEYEIEYYAPDESAVNFTDTNNYVMLSGLTMGTTYTVRVRCVCENDDYGTWDSVTFLTASCPTPTFLEISAQTLGVGSSTSDVNPTNGCYEYSYTQQIYDSTLLTSVSTIHGISFKINVTAATTRNVDVYLGTTTQSTFSSPYNYVTAANLTQVASGTIDCSQTGWFTITFDSAYTYTGGNLVVAVDDNTGSYYCTPEFASHSTSGNKCIDFYQDMTNISPSSPSADMEESYPNRPDVRFIMPCDSVATCIAPNLVVASVTSTEATLIWAPGGSESSWDVDYRAVTSSTWSSPENVTASPYTITGLTPNTDYVVRLANDCGDTILYAMAYFTTDCGPMAVPFNEGFDSWSSSTADPLGDCWYKNTNYSTSYPYASTGYNHNPGGSKSLYMYSSNSSWTYMVLPETAAPVDSLQVRFWLYRTNSSYTHRLVVGVITDITDVNTFVPVDTVACTGVSTWEEMTVPMVRYTGPTAGARIAIMSPNNEYSYPYLDDLTVEYIPDCLPVDNLTAENITQNSADIRWEELGDATSWEVEYGVSGFTLGTGTTVSATDTVVNITGLMANTLYDVYVTPDCGSGIAGMATTSFRTNCGYIDSLPYFEDFESYPDGTSSILPPECGVPCWHRLDNASTYHFGYIGSRSSWPSGGHSGTGFLYYYMPTTTGSYADWIITVLPPINPTLHPMNTLQMSFWVKMNSSSTTGDIVVGVMTDPTVDSTFVPVDTVHVAGDVYDMKEAYFTSYTDTGAYIALKYFRNPSTTTYYFVDDFTVEPIPDCPPVQDIALAGLDSSMLSVTWTEVGSATSWNVEYGPHGFSLGSGTTATATAVPFNITGLTPNTDYDVYVTPDCGSGVAGTRMGTFRTANTYIGLPFVCNFEDTAQNTIWVLENGSMANKWYIGTAASNGGSNGLYISSDNGSTNTYNGSSSSMVYAYVDLMVPAAGEYGYTYDWKCNGESSYDFLRVALVPVSEALTASANMPSGFSSTSIPATWISLDGNTPLNQQTSWQTRTDVFNLTSAGVYHLVFAWRNDGSVGNNPPIAVDNIEFVRSVCARPDNITISNLTQTSAEFTWSEVGTATEWEYQVGSDSIYTVYDTTVILTGLSANTSYTFKVRSVCDDSNSSFWRTYSFRTPCGFITLPFSDDFESYPTGSSTTGSSFADCWYRLNNGTSYGGYPYISSSSTYNHTPGGSKGLYWYNTNTTGSYGDYQCIALPPVDTTINVSSLQLSFWAKASTNTPVFQIGVMTDPNDITSFVGVDTVIISSTSWTNVEVPLGLYTGNGQYVAVKADRDANYWYGYVDDFTLDYTPTCIAPRDIHATAATTTTLTIDWTDITPATQWQVEYGPQGYTQGSADGTMMTVYAHPVNITGLTALTPYDIYVRPICSVGDTAAWYYPTVISTEMCDNPTYVQNFDSTSSMSTTSYFPGYATYNYSFCEVIIDSADMAAGGLTPDQDISAFMYNPTTTTANTYYTNCDIYMANTTATDLNSGFILVDSTFVQVATNIDLSFTDVGWQVRGFTTPFNWDGHSNVVFAVNRKHGSWTSSTSFQSHMGRSGQGRYVYNDGSAYNPTSVSGGTVTNNIANYRFISCGSPNACPAPVITSVTQDYHSGTVTWSGSGNSYQVNVKETAALDWPATDIAVTGTTYTFNGLNSETAYTFRVRQDCTADSNDYSEWTYGAFTTDSLPCLAPDSLVVTDITNAQATFSWTVLGNETQWDIHVWTSGGLDSVYRVTTNPATVGGFTAGVTYNAAVRAVCGVEEFEGEYGETITFTTLTCPDVTGLTTSNVTSSSVTLNWTADAMAESWMIEYGFRGFAQGTGTSVTSDVNTYVVTGLDDETAYDFYVKAVCGDNWNSEGWTQVTATTLTAEDPTYTVTVNVNDDAMGSATGGGTFHAGESCTVTATANDGYHFVNWSNGETDNPYTFTVVANITLTANFAANGTQGIEDVDGTFCTIYPNPTSDVTTISVSGVNGVVRIAVVDMNGRTVASETLECSSDCEKTMDVDKLAQGAYFVRITGDNVNMVKKLVVR